MIQGCGVAAVLSEHGTVLAEGDNVWFSGRSSAAEGGLFVTHGEGWSRRPRDPDDIVDAHGELFATLEGAALNPLATDGSGGIRLDLPAAERPSDGVMLWTDGVAIGAVGADAEERWRVEHLLLDDDDLRDAALVAGGALVRARDVVVLHATWGRDGSSHVVALDQQTGEARWWAPLEGSVPWAEMHAVVRGAWTDGQVMVVATPGDLWGDLTPQRWTAFDLDSGAVVWTYQREPAAEGWLHQCSAALGRLVCDDSAGRIWRAA